MKKTKKIISISCLALAIQSFSLEMINEQSSNDSLNYNNESESVSKIEILYTPKGVILRKGNKCINMSSALKNYLDNDVDLNEKHLEYFKESTLLRLIPSKTNKEMNHQKFIGLARNKYGRLFFYIIILDRDISMVSASVIDSTNRS